jgi:periplasmic protein TonB
MRLGLFIGFLFAAILHVGFFTFGGALFGGATTTAQHNLSDVELISAEEEKEESKKPDEPEPEDLENETEEPPDAAEIMKNLETASVDPPALDAASLGAIEAALAGLAGSGGDFAQAMDLSSGGRIGGTGKAGSLQDQLETAFSLSEIDQKPRAIYQTSPMYPSEMRGKKIEGVVTVLFVVDASGKVTNLRVEKSSAVTFEKPAMEAVRRWKFEPAIKGGQRVACKMRVPIRFQPN